LLILGLPLWWWSFWKIYAWLGHPVDPAVGSTLVGCQLYAGPFALVFVGWCSIDLLIHGIEIARLKRVQQFAPTRPGYGVADFGVPYCRYEPAATGGGFKVTVKNNNYGSSGCLVSTVTIPTLGILYYFFGGVSTAFLVFLVATVAGLYFSFHRVPSRIEVRGDTIIINGTRLERDHFKSFNVHARRQLGYQYGLQNYWFPGTWTEVEVTAIASALNAHFLIASADEGATPDPDDLRNRRPSDF